MAPEVGGSDVPQQEWADHWSYHLADEDQAPELFLDWIAPNEPSLFQGARVLDAGCGGGHHSAYVSRFAKEVVAVDLNTVGVCNRRLDPIPNVTLHQANIQEMTSDELGGPFDVVYSVGVVHHTFDPDATFANLVKHLKPGGRLIVWVYSLEGNEVARYFVEPARTLFLRHLPSRAVHAISWGITLPALAAMHTLYRLPLPSLPLYDYLAFQRKLSARRVMINVFDKLIAPHTDFISEERARRWLDHPELTDTHLSPYLGVSWRISATKR